MSVLALSWGVFVIVGLAVAAGGALLIGLIGFVGSEVVGVEDPEDRWARESSEAGW